MHPAVITQACKPKPYTLDSSRQLLARPSTSIETAIDTATLGCNVNDKNEDRIIKQSLDCSLVHERLVSNAVKHVKKFYRQHTQIKASHGWEHIRAVIDHTVKALLSLKLSPKYSHEQHEEEGMLLRIPSEVEQVEIQLASLLHDVDDRKYFPNTNPGEYPNATKILQDLGIDVDSVNNDEKDESSSSTYSYTRILKMISWVGCSENGNSVPTELKQSQAFHLLIPRWADRLEAVGSRGVVRCYQYNQEKGQPLSSDASPRPQSEEELWTKYATPNKLQEYMNRGGKSTDMISHYYDKLLHIAKPPVQIVRNSYLECQAESSSKELVELCLRYGMTGQVDEEYIMSLMVD